MCAVYDADDGNTIVDTTLSTDNLYVFDMRDNMAKVGTIHW